MGWSLGQSTTAGFVLVSQVKQAVLIVLKSTSSELVTGLLMR